MLPARFFAVALTAVFTAGFFAGPFATGFFVVALTVVFTTGFFAGPFATGFFAVALMTLFAAVFFTGPLAGPFVTCFFATGVTRFAGAFPAGPLEVGAFAIVPFRADVFGAGFLVVGAFFADRADPAFFDGDVPFLPATPFAAARAVPRDAVRVDLPAAIYLDKYA